MTEEIKNDQEILTKEELTLLVNVVAQLQVPVKESPKFVELINKMTRIAGEAK